MGNTQVNIEELRRGGVVALKKNQFSVWVKTACCNLNAQQVYKLADIADKYGQGIVLFTTRQIPIIPFIDIQDVTEVKRELNEANLELDRCGSRVRNLNVCYQDKICSEAEVNCLSLGEKLEKFFASELLHKIKIGIAGCQRNCTGVRILNDIGFIGRKTGRTQGYAAYVGGRLGLNPFIGVLVAELLSEDESVKLVQNYFDLLVKQGQKGERAADLINRLGADRFKAELTSDLQENRHCRIMPCPNKLEKPLPGREILKIRATCGEVNTRQVRIIAEIADKFGSGFIHFTVRGAPEIPGIRNCDLSSIREEIQKVDLSLVDNGIENLQTCFGNYCLESLADPQALLRKIEKMLHSQEYNSLKISVSASGCPNSCGIAHISDIGFHGMVEVLVDSSLCNGCGLCTTICKKKALEISSKKARINERKCGHCGQCAAICPLNALRDNNKGFAVLLGGRSGLENRLGVKIAEYVSEEKALIITRNLLNLAKDNNTDVEALIDHFGIEKVSAIIIPAN